MNQLEHFEALVNEARAGNGDALPVAVSIKQAIARLEELYGMVKEQAYTEFKRKGASALTVNGCVVTEYSGKTTYDYKDIAGWQAANTRMKAIEEQAKLAYRLISDGKVPVEDGCAIIDGELVQPAKAKFSPPSISVKI